MVMRHASIVLGVMGKALNADHLIGTNHLPAEQRRALSHLATCAMPLVKLGLGQHASAGRFGAVRPGTRVAEQSGADKRREAKRSNEHSTTGPGDASPGQWPVLEGAWTYEEPGSGERRLLLGQATKTVFEIYLGGALGAELGQLSLQVTHPGAKKRHLIEEPAVGSRCNITEQGLGHLKGLHGQTYAGPEQPVRVLKGGIGWRSRHWNGEVRKECSGLDARVLMRAESSQVTTRVGPLYRHAAYMTGCTLTPQTSQ
jgi:hypothetical protein